MRWDIDFIFSSFVAHGGQNSTHKTRSHAIHDAVRDDQLECVEV